MVRARTATPSLRHQHREQPLAVASVGACGARSGSAPARNTGRAVCACSLRDQPCGNTTPALAAHTTPDTVAHTRTRRAWRHRAAAGTCAHQPPRVRVARRQHARAAGATSTARQAGQQLAAACSSSSTSGWPFSGCCPAACTRSACFAGPPAIQAVLHAATASQQQRSRSQQPLQAPACTPCMQAAAQAAAWAGTSSSTRSTPCRTRQQLQQDQQQRTACQQQQQRQAAAAAACLSAWQTSAETPTAGCGTTSRPSSEGARRVACVRACGF
jgi:hypothetical protein